MRNRDAPIVNVPSMLCRFGVGFICTAPSQKSKCSSGGLARADYGSLGKPTAWAITIF